MHGLEAQRITADQIRDVLNPPRGFELWLSYFGGAWSVVVAGAVDGTEEHVLTRCTVVARSVRFEDGWDYVLSAYAMNAVLYGN
jgi:hypothetical protein